MKQTHVFFLVTVISAFLLSGCSLLKNRDFTTSLEETPSAASLQNVKKNEVTAVLQAVGTVVPVDAKKSEFDPADFLLLTLVIDNQTDFPIKEPVIDLEKGFLHVMPGEDIRYVQKDSPPGFARLNITDIFPRSQRELKIYVAAPWKSTHTLKALIYDKERGLVSTSTSVTVSTP